jgi:serine/threonine-protein kinase
MSPEQARGDAVDWRSDVFSTGVLLFELTTGKRLFKAKTEYDTLKLICDTEYPLPSQASPGYPRELEAIVMRALAKDRTQRWQSAREMQAAIEELVRRERLPVSTIALSQFMQSLFEEKLASQKQKLLEGKQLADVIALERGDDSGSGDSHARAPLSMGPASRTVTDVKPRGSRGAWAGAAAAAVIAAAAGTIYVARQAPPAPAAEQTEMRAMPAAAAAAAAAPAAVEPGSEAKNDASADGP